MTQYEQEETENSERAIEETEDVEALRQSLAEEKERAGDYLANWQRTQADFVNYKRRNEQERAEFYKSANAGLILNLLPVLDDIERAIASLPHRTSRSGWVDGLRLIESKFRTSLEAQGLTQIKALGEPFDPRFHEAIRQDKGKEGIVIEELQRGYIINDKVLRPSTVVVGNGENKTKENI
ncbi:nucleotide exchange factor GrpE [Chloroflexota bacterium]